MGLDIHILRKAITPDPELEKIFLEDNDHEVGYFRKFNALLNWVSTHVKNVENCEEVLLTREHLETLKATLQNLNQDNCHELLPTQDGFFFGSLEYDDNYWEDVNELRPLLDNLLTETNFESERLFFWAWW